MTGEYQDSESSLAGRHHDVADDDHLLRRDPIREHTAEQQERQGWRNLSGEHIRQLRRGAVSGVEDRERDTDK